MKDHVFTSINSPSTTDQNYLPVNFHSLSLYSHWPCAASGV